MEEEQVKYIYGYEGKYIVTSKGRIFSTNYNNTGKTRELKQKINRFGFCEVKLSLHNIAKDYMVARLVAEAFIPNPMQKDYVMHISKDKTDNSVYNLQWAYSSEVKHNMYNKGSRKEGEPTLTNITYNGKNYVNYVEIAKEVGMKPSVFKKRLERGWGLYEALEVPVGRGK